MIRYITIVGTHGARREADWDSPESHFSKLLMDHDCAPLIASPLKRYMWSTSLDGVDGSNDTWDAAGRALADYIAPPLLLGKSLLAPEDTYLITHSHGGNVVAYACGKYDLKVNGLITVGMPIRKDMEPMYTLAAPNIKHHLHLYSGWKDFWQVLGAFRDGRFGIHRQHPYAINRKAPGAHGSVLREDRYLPLWESEGWLDVWLGR